MKKIIKYEFLILCIFFIILTIPRSINDLFFSNSYILNVIKLITTLIIYLYSFVCIFIKKNLKISKLTKGVLFLSIYLLIITFLNKVSLITFFKVYCLNVGMLLLCDLLFNDRFKIKFIKFFSNYYLTLIILNIICIVFGFLLGMPNGDLFQKNGVYLLGSDNRFILYIIPTLLGFYYLKNITSNNKKYNKKLYFTYIISIITLFSIWSVSAMVVMLGIGFIYIILNKFKKIKLNFIICTITIFIISISIVFFKAHHLFSYFIVNVLHKSLDLSYRSILWDDAIHLLKNNIENLIFGFGYFDTSNSFVNMPLKANHLHNIIMNNLFFSGIVGSVIYYYNFYQIEKNIISIKNNCCKNVVFFAFSSLLVLMIFDTFELYQIYYFILYLLYCSKDILNMESKNNNKKKSGKEISVSICCITYNQEKYIKQTIESFIHQKTDFNYEIIIHDDASTDGTVEIIKNYQKKYPKIIKPILQKENQYSKGNDVVDIVFKKVKGKYIALCEGDDYWCDQYKLQKQFDFIENHYDCSLIVNGALLLNENNKKIYKKKQPFIGSRYYNTDEIIMYDGDLFATNSMFFKTKYIRKLPNFYYNAPVGDYPLTIYLSFCGKVYFMKDNMSVYRINAQGSWSNNMKNGNYIEKKEKLYNELSKMFDEINLYTKFKYRNSIDYVLSKRKLELLLLSNNSFLIKKEDFKILYNKGTISNRIKNLLKIKIPNLYNKLKNK